MLQITRRLFFQKAKAVKVTEDAFCWTQHGSTKLYVPSVSHIKALF